MELAPYLREEHMLILPGLTNRDELLEQIATLAAGSLDGLDAAELTGRLLKREESAPTGTIEGVAFPHVLSEDIGDTVVIVALAPSGVQFSGPAGGQCDLIFAMFGNAAQPWNHVRLLARMARLLHTEDSRKRLRAASTPQELLAALLAEDRAHG